MDGVSRIATWKRAAQGPAVLVEVDGKEVKVAHADLITYDTAAKIKTELEARAGKVLSGLFVHRNRDGSLAVAVGQEPGVWPEDLPPDPDPDWPEA